MNEPSLSGEKNLLALLRKMLPVLRDEEYVFITLSGAYGDHAHLNPLCSFSEEEGLTLIVPKQTAINHSIDFEGSFKKITLKVHSSLNAVGLTAAVAAKLAEENISANVVAAFYHDHIFVPAEKADQALDSLKALSKG